jgi:hypothetical protein
MSKGKDLKASVGQVEFIKNRFKNYFKCEQGLKRG